MPQPAEVAWDEAARQLTVPFEYRPLTQQEDIAYGQKSQQDAICEAQWVEWQELGFVGNASPGNAAVSAAEVSESPHKGWHSRGYLPHFDAEHAIQFVTFRLHDSVPADVIERWKQELQWSEATAPDSKEAAALREKVEEYEDSGTGACYLRDERVARLIEDALKRFDGERYRLIAWCVMPNHVHVLIEMKGHSLSEIVPSWKSFVAHGANTMLGRSGPFWMPDYYDRFIRDDNHLVATVEYILQNPVKAGLVDTPESWPWAGCIVNAGETPAIPGRDARAPRIAFLKSHPSLMLDTKHFDSAFVDRLLAGFSDLDEVTDGVLLHSENYQALNLLVEKYREQVKCIYLDPPYNSKTTEILYKNSYKHSSCGGLARLLARRAAA